MAHFFKYLAGTEAGSDVHISQTTQRLPLKGQLKVGLYGGSNLIVEMNRLAGGTPDSAAGQPIYAKVEPADAATVAPPLSQVFVVTGLVLGEMNLRCANPTDFVTWDTVRIKVVDASKKAAPTLTDDLKAEYKSLFAACKIRSANQSDVDDMAKKIVAGKDRYSAVGTPLSIPWWFIGILHALESSANFAKHLHNGDPLTARTTHVPAGRPTTGNPPFTWEDSAKDALTYHNFNTWTDWSLPGALFEFEKYNGFGVRMYHAEMLSAYLWSYTTLYGTGKYGSDGKWDATLTSKQPGTAALLKALIRDKAVTGLD
jgi:lysozyme family protein